MGGRFQSGIVVPVSELNHVSRGISKDPSPFSSLKKKKNLELYNISFIHNSYTPILVGFSEPGQKMIDS